MPIGIYLNATTGGTNGTLEVANNGDGLHLTALNTAGTVHFRAGSGTENSESFTVPAPANCQVSKNNSTWASSVTFAAGEVGPTNVPCYFRRTSGTTLVSTGIATTPRLAQIATQAVVVPDTTSPTLTGALTAATGTAAGSVNLSWPAGSDNVAVTGYDIEYGPTTSYGFSTTSVSTSKTITGLSPGDTYHFRVRAYDAAGNKSGWLTASAASASAGDTTAPVLSGTLTATPDTSQVALSWPAGSDSVGVTGYDVEYGTTTSYGTATTSTTTSKTITGLTAGTPYYFRVRAYDAAGNTSGWITATATTQFLVALSGTLSASAVGMNVVLSGITATAGSGQSIARFEGRHKLTSESEWSGLYTLMTAWGSPNSLAAPKLPYIVPATGAHDVQIRAVDSAGGVSAWLSTTVTTAYTSLPVSDSFSGLSDGASIDGYNGWWVSKIVANNANGTIVKGTHSGLTGAVLKNNAPVASPATSANVECRKLVGIDVQDLTYFEAVLTPVSSSVASRAIGLRMGYGAGGSTIALVSINYNGSTLTCYNGSAFATIKTGLSGNITLRVVPIYGTQTAAIFVNGESLGEIQVWRVIDQPVAYVQIDQNPSSLTTDTTCGFGSFAIGRV